MNKIKIALDAGHGGIDNGTHGGGMQEEKVNLNVALELQKLLNESGHYEVFMTRVDDKFLSLSQRSAVINKFAPNIAIAIHHNAGGGHGYDLIYNVKKTTSYALALHIAQEYDAIGQTKHKIYFRTNIIGNDYYSIQRLTKAPCVITEFAFMDTDDVKDIDTSTEQKNEAMAIFKAINKFYNL